jgi:hypothetical protein
MNRVSARGRTGARILVVGTTALLLVGGVSACGDDEPESQVAAEQDICDSLVDVKVAAEAVRALDGSSTVEEAEAAVAALDEAKASVLAEAGELSAADQAALSSSVAAVASAVQGISGSDTLGAAADSVQASTAAVNAAVTQAANGVQCTITVAPTTP